MRIQHDIRIRVGQVRYQSISDSYKGGINNPQSRTYACVFMRNSAQIIKSTDGEMSPIDGNITIFSVGDATLIQVFAAESATIGGTQSRPICMGGST